MIKTMNKILLSILILVFIFANVSFTVVLHYCEMMKQTSKSECGMCEVEEETSDFGFNVLSFNDLDNQACCKNFVKTTDQIDSGVLKKTDSNEIKEIQSFTNSIINIEFLLQASIFIKTNTHSPPLKIPSYLSNSILLI